MEEERMTRIHPVNGPHESQRFLRFGAIALALSGVLFFLYPVIRPWHDESTVGGAEASMSSDAWVVAHLFAMLALILMPLGMLALSGLLARSRSGGLGLAATATMWVGAGLTLPYYGAEDFALHAIATQASSGATLDLLGLVAAIRFSAVAAISFATGLIMLGVSGVLIAISIWRTAILPRFSGVPLAIGLVLLIPQFYLPGWARIAHGLLVAIGLVWLAVALWTSRSNATDQFRSTLEEQYVDSTPFPSKQARVGRDR
jgi:hypothetical protein